MRNSVDQIRRAFLPPGVFIGEEGLFQVSRMGLCIIYPLPNHRTAAQQINGEPFGLLKAKNQSGLTL